MAAFVTACDGSLLLVVMLSFGFSPCPNDTFAFGAAVHGVVDMRGMRFDPVLLDIEALNQRAVTASEPLAITKLSLPALAHVSSDYSVLASGSALGFGCGPLVVCRADAEFGQLADLSRARVAIPGRHTTAFLLLRSLGVDEPAECIPMRFDEIMPAVSSGAVDAGLIIHESRFTFSDHGLRKLADLGELFEAQTGGPLPLGVIAARRDLDDETFANVSAVLKASVRYARQHPEQARPYVRRHAQEMSDEVCDRHIALYVNEFTEDLGTIGRNAIEQLLTRGRSTGLLPAGPSAFRENL